MPRTHNSSPFSPEILRTAYAHGFFPMPHPVTGQIHWFNPDPRAIIPLAAFHCSHSLHRSLRKKNFEITIDKAFSEVMRGCANRDETWITEDFINAYTELHHEGDAHSIEVWAGTSLVGGVYGISLGGAFFAESMFSKIRDASKIALFHLVERLKGQGFTLLEVQFLTPHLASLGAVEISAEEYLVHLQNALLLDQVFNNPPFNK